MKNKNGLTEEQQKLMNKVLGDSLKKINQLNQSKINLIDATKTRTMTLKHKSLALIAFSFALLLLILIACEYKSALDYSKEQEVSDVELIQKLDSLRKMVHCLN